MRILSLAPLAGPGLDALRGLGDLELDPWNQHVPIKLHSADELRARLAGVDALIVEADHIPADVIASSTLRMLGVCRGDPVNVDLDAATKHGVAVVRAPARNAEAVAELTLGLFFALLRNIVRADGDVRAGRWVVDGRIAQQRYLGRELASCLVGIIGFGAIGRALARRLEALGVRALAYDPGVPHADIIAAGVEPIDVLDELLERVDILSVHTPLTDATRGLIGEAQLGRMKSGALLVNTARYGIVDEQPMLDALRAGRLAGAAFDHFHNEFLAPDHPLVSMSNVILTPHIGGSTIETIETHTQIIASGFAAIVAGHAPSSLVNPAALPLGTS